MNNPLANPVKQEQQNWRWKAYAFGLVAGVLFGIGSAYMYTRAAEEDAMRTGRPAPVGTGELLGLGLAALAMVRQITEMGRAPEKHQKKR